MKIKNFIGNFLGYGRCPVTQDTYWNTDLVSVPYSERSGIIISKRALSEVPKEKIAEMVLETSRTHVPHNRRFSLQEIVEQIPSGCMSLPKVSSL